MSNVTASIQYQVLPMVNLDSRFGKYAARQRLAFPERLPTFTFKALTPMQAAEMAYCVGNRMGADTEGRTWPSSVRSLSVGDVVMVVDPEGSTSPLAVSPIGFRLLTQGEVMDVMRHLVLADEPCVESGAMSASA